MKSAKIMTLTVFIITILLLGSNLMAVNFANIFSGIPSATAQICNTPPSGMVSWWPGDGNANDIKDGNSGTLLPDTSFESGQVDKGFRVKFQPPGNGPGFSAISGPIGGFPLGDSPRTIIAWIKTGVVPDQTFGSGILHYGTQDGTLPPKNFHMHIDTDGKAGVGNGWGHGVAKGTSSVLDNQFHFLAGTYEGPSTDIARIYVDGIEQGSAKITTPATGSQDPFRIGSFMPSGSPGIFEHGHFEGIIDEVAIFNRALSQSEIQAIFDADSVGMCKNPLPTANAGSDQTVNEGSGTVTLDGTGSTASGAGGTIDEYKWEQVGGPAVTLNGADTASATFEAPADVASDTTLTFKLTVTDYEGGTDDDEVIITVKNVNKAPVAKDESVSTDEDTSPPITLTATDADGDALTYTIVDKPLHGTISGTPPAVTYNPAANYNGPDSFTFKANDGQADSNIAKVSITVKPVNDNPTVNTLTAEPTTINEGETSALSAGATDADGDSLTYSWSQTAGTVGTITVDSTDPSKATFEAPSVEGDETATIQVTVDDGSVGGTDSKTVDIIVNDVPPPDTTPPETKIDSATDGNNNDVPNGGTTSSSSITFTFSSTDSDVAKFQCSEDGAAWEDCTSPEDYTSLSDGSHNFGVIAIDNAGNADQTPATWSWKVQTTTAPKYTINGFYAPVDMEDANGDPIVNIIKNGRSVALKFEVFDQNNIEQTSTDVIQSFKQNQISCSTLQGDAVDAIEITNTGGTSLRYEDGTFLQNWKTPRLAGNCYSAIVTTVDGFSITAYFKLN